jgi:photosystem II stability/assembly factor-like uncharacterized protein
MTIARLSFFLAAVLLIAAPVRAAETIALRDVAHIHGVAIDPEDPTRLFLATHHGLYRAAPDGTAVRVSDHQDDLMGFTPHPREPKTFFATGHPARGGNLGFIVSKDGGVTWQQLSRGARGPVDFHQMDVSRSDPSVVYGVYGGLQRSRDGGRTWEIVGPEPEGLIDLAVSPESPDKLYAATRGGLLQSRDGGRSWGPAFMLRRPATMVESTADGSVYAFIAGTGLFQRDGDNWRRIGTPPGNALILYFAAVPGRMVAVAQEDKIFVSTDGAMSWQPFAGR